MVKLPVLFGATSHELPSLICSTLKRTSPPAVLPRNLVWIHRHRKKGMLFVCSCRACLTQLHQFVPRKWRDGIFPSFCLLHCSFSDAFSRSMFKAVTPLWDRPYEDQLQVTHVHSALHKQLQCTYILCIIHLMCGIGLFFIATSSSSLTVQIACHLIFCC